MLTYFQADDWVIQNAANLFVKLVAEDRELGKSMLSNESFQPSQNDISSAPLIEAIAYGIATSAKSTLRDLESIPMPLPLNLMHVEFTSAPIRTTVEGVYEDFVFDLIYSHFKDSIHSASFTYQYVRVYFLSLNINGLYSNDPEFQTLISQIQGMIDTDLLIGFLEKFGLQLIDTAYQDIEGMEYELIDNELSYRQGICFMNMARSLRGDKTPYIDPKKLNP